MPTEVYDAIVVGAGQAGLATGYYLQKSGLRFIILEQATQLGSSWRNRYDSLRLFTPAKYSSLPGLPFPLAPNICPTKNQVAEYFEQYVTFHQLPVRLGIAVKRVSKSEDLFEVRTQNRTDEEAAYYARQVVVATGSSQHPYIPVLDTQPDSCVFQVHSSQYTNPSILPAGNALVVGGGNSGAQLAVELARSPSQEKVYLSVNVPLVFKPLRLFGKSIFWWGEMTGLFNLSPRSWLGRRMKKQQTEGIYCDELKALIKKQQILVVPEIQSFEGRKVWFRNGTEETFAAIIWATGFRSKYDWLDIPGALDKSRMPLHKEGISPVNGLYFMGLVWQRTTTSSLILGAAKDARFIAEALLRQLGVGN